MRKATIALAVLTAVGLSPALALAQDKPAAGGGAAVAAGGAPPAGNVTVQYKQKTVYDFDDDTVEGDLVRPDGEFVDSRRGAKHSSLIKIRDNFIPEMLKSVESL